MGKGEIIDRIVAIVNDDIITLSDLEQFRQSFYRDSPEISDWLGREFYLLDVRQQVLNTLIEEKLVDQEAERRNINVSQKQLETTLESIRQDKGLSEYQLKEVLRSQGLTYEEYTAQVEKGLRRTKLVNQVVAPEIEVEEETLKAYYETHINDYMVDESIRISHILLPVPSNASNEEEDATLSMAKDILRRLENGEDFENLAREYSQNLPDVRVGDLGFFKRGEMIPAIEETAFSLNVGKGGGPIRTPEGIVLIKVTDKKEGSPTSFPEIKEKVKRDYYRNEGQRRYQEWIKELKERSFIEVKL
jgi:peptidyl-prolyl cis-trans isomerase SurA